MNIQFEKIIVLIFYRIKEPTHPLRGSLGRLVGASLGREVESERKVHPYKSHHSQREEERSMAYRYSRRLVSRMPNYCWRISGQFREL